MRAVTLALAAAAAALPSALARSCPFSFASGYDLNGGDLPNQPVSTTVSTPAECAALCCANANCYAFSLNAGAANGRWCYLKAANGWSNSSVAGVDSGSLPPPPPNTSFPWFNVSIPPAQRVALLVAAMTVEEQISWLDDASPAIPRLGLPAYSWEAEALHGVSWAGVATVFPSNIAWGASFDTSLVSSIGDVIATEARAKWLGGLAADGSSQEFFGLSFMTPNNNLFINPTWGRGQETYGEEPTLTSALTYYLVKALQYGPGCGPSADGVPGTTLHASAAAATAAAGSSQPEHSTEQQGPVQAQARYQCSAAYNRMIAVSKHFMAYHLESHGTDGQYRLSHSFNLTETDIQQTYLPPFAAAVQAGVSSVMCAYDGQNGTNPAWPNPGGPEPWGVPMCLNPDMQRLLRDQLGWQGYVISDEGAITFAGPGYHGYTSTVQDAACLALNAGTDLALGGEFGPHLGACLQAGNITAARIAQALTRTLSAHMRLGWFDTLAARAQGLPDPVPYNANISVAANVSSPEHRALSRLAAKRGLVLLKNAGGNTLPLNPSPLAGKKLALIGPGATYTGTSTGSYIGNYPACVDGPGANLTPDPRCHVVTLLEALTNASTSYGFTLGYAQGTDVNTVNGTGIPAAVAAAAGSEVIIAALGLDTCQESYCSEGEANDRGRGSDSAAPSVDLPGSQLQLLQALVGAYPTTPIILVLLNGGPVSSPYAYGQAAAVLEAWYPGYEGGAAITEALLGSYSPAGRLPVTIVTDLSQVAPVTDFIMSTPPGRTSRYYTGTPAFPFGFGLSYANFSYTGLSITPSTLSPSDESFTVSATVTSHAGGMVSDEVTQLYGSFQQASTGVASIPRQQLLNFTRVYDVAPGASLPVSFTVPRQALALMSPSGVMGVQSGVWRLYLGGGPPSNEQYGGGAVLQGTLTVQ